MRPIQANATLAAALSFSLAATTACAAKPADPVLSTADFQQCLDRLKNTSQFSGVTSAFTTYRPTAPDPSVISSLNYQPEFQKDVWDYLASLVDKERVDDGIRVRQQWADTLNQIEARYGVKPEHVLGVWGVESNFGQTLGKKSLFDSLATLSCFDRRQTYFRTEYANALKIVQKGDIAPNDMTGSWAGAFGQTQFMPSTFLELAVDFDGDGRRDLVNSVPDALASTANFLAKRGYRSGEAWGYEVKKPAGFVGTSNRKDKKPMSHWRDKGFTLANGEPLPNDLNNAALLMPAGSQGPTFLVGKNFDAFYSYNASENYALAIAHLSDLISRQDSSKTDFVTAWPTDDPGISRQQSKVIQQALSNAGYDIGEVDGIIGDNTRLAIQLYQKKLGISPADGRSGQKFYNLISQDAALMQSAKTVTDMQSPQAAAAPSLEEEESDHFNGTKTVSTNPSAERKSWLGPLSRNKVLAGLGVLSALFALCVWLMLRNKRARNTRPYTKR